MSEDFEKLKSIGVQKIHEATHISRTYVQAILDENFGNMSSVQLRGFLSILEREYGIDLSELKNRTKTHVKYDDTASRMARSTELFGSFKKKKDFRFAYVIVGAVVFILFVLLSSDSSDNETPEINNSVIESAKVNMLAADSDKNISEVDENSTINKEALTASVEPTTLQPAVQVADALQKPTVKETAVQQSSFKITPKHEVWLGYIDLSTYKRYQKMFSDELALDPAKEWLLFIGHGQINIEINGVTKSFSDKNSMRFIYKNSELKPITLEEYKALNKGNGW